MALTPDKVATIHFTIKDDKGIIQDSTEGQPPYSFICSSGQMFQKVEEALASIKPGDKKTLKLAPADAYGDYDKDFIKVTDPSHFPDGAELKEGMTFLTMVEEQETPVTIKKIEENAITIDFNHPLAGRTLDMELELIEVRNATKEELEHGHVHGEGCSH